MDIFTFFKKIHCPECSGKFNYIKSSVNLYNTTQNYIYCENYINHGQKVYFFETCLPTTSILLVMNNLQINFIYNYDNGTYFFTFFARDNSYFESNLKSLIQEFYKKNNGSDGFDKFLITSQDLINTVYKYNNNLIFI